LNDIFRKTQPLGVTVGRFGFPFFELENTAHKVLATGKRQITGVPDGKKPYRIGFGGKVQRLNPRRIQPLFINRLPQRDQPLRQTFRPKAGGAKNPKEQKQCKYTHDL
jgi:hypothetical protein